jgi:hypothetical protein
MPGLDAVRSVRTSTIDATVNFAKSLFAREDPVLNLLGFGDVYGPGQDFNSTKQPPNIVGYDIKLVVGDITERQRCPACCEVFGRGRTYTRRSSGDEYYFAGKGFRVSHNEQLRWNKLKQLGFIVNWELH